VLKGQKTWIGYIPRKDTFETLPTLKSGILNPGDLFTELKLDTEKMAQLNMLYAKDYSLYTDAEILFKAWNNLNRNHE
jgi:lipopolysaccharide/colanic/teichoic acid biosynthesis glycosyltransferase